MNRFGESYELEFLLNDKSTGFITGVVLPIDASSLRYPKQMTYGRHISQIPRRKQRGIKIAAPQGAGYLTLAAFAKWTYKYVRLAHCSRE